MKAHPFAEEYPPTPPAKVEEITANMKAVGFDKRFPIVRYKKQILDGRTRFAAAKVAGVKPRFIDFKGDDEAARRFVETANYQRRHLSPEQEDAVRAARDARIVESRQAGKTIRDIAADEGVSAATVHATLKEAETCSALNTSPPDGTVTDSRGRKHPAKKPNRQKQARNGDSTVQRRTVESPGDADESVIEDVEGVPVPEQARVAFLGAPAMTEVGRDIDAIGQRVKAISETPAGRLVQYEDVRLHLKNAKGGVLQNKPTHVCPLCQGKKKDCQCCKGTGWTVEHVHKRLTAEAKR